MPFDLTNAPAAFQRFTNDIFSDLLDICVLIYIDDILIYSNTPEEYQKHVKEVLCRLRKHKIYAIAEKCEFHRDRLNTILSPTGLIMVDNKISVIQEWCHDLFL
jgi:Reverse transcriptase (RNA-dependent DNA polymerase)